MGNDATGPEVWVTDGTPSGTHLVRDIWKDGPKSPGRSAPAVYPVPSFQGVAGNRVLFTANDGTGEGLWAADDQDAWPLALKSWGYEPGSAVSLRDGALLRATRLAQSPIALWLTDGLLSGTTQVSDVEVGGANLTSVAQQGDGMYFSGRSNTGTSTYDLWVTDGRNRNTRRVAVAEGVIDQVTVAGPHVFFEVRRVISPSPNFVSEKSLWRYDIALGVAGRLAILPESAGILGPVGDQVALAREGTDQVRRLWLSDDGPAGMHVLGDIQNPSRFANAPIPPPASDGRWIFMAQDADHGVEPWLTDGTATGTRILRDLNPGPAKAQPGNFVPCGNRFIFTANLGEGRGYWISDGTPSGTRLMPEVLRWGLPDVMGCIGDTLIFSVPEGSGRAIYSDDLRRY